MFATFKQRLILAFFVIVILSIPIGAYVISQRQQSSPRPKPEQPVTTEPDKKESASEKLKVSDPKKSTSSAKVKPPLVEEPAVSFGPTLNLKLILEGRPQNDQTSQIFVGIAQGTPATNPNYLLSFTISLPADGIFNGLSIAGLNPGTQYSAFLKGPAQIATSSAFIMSAAVTNLNSGNPLTLLTGDLNEDNVINSADFSIALSAFGAKSGQAKWNSNIDFNRDGIINTADIGLLIRNFGKNGASGAWVSTPKVATPSGSVATSSGIPATPSGQTSGYWIWVPKLD